MLYEVITIPGHLLDETSAEVTEKEKYGHPEQDPDHLLVENGDSRRREDPRPAVHVQ